MRLESVTMGWKFGRFCKLSDKTTHGIYGGGFVWSNSFFRLRLAKILGMHIPVDFVRFQEYDKQQIGEGCFELNQGI